MPSAREVAQSGSGTGPQERLDFVLDASCPGLDVYNYYSSHFESMGYSACTPQDPEWRFFRDVTAGYSYRQFRAYWASQSAGEFVILSARCVTDEVDGTGREQRIIMGVFRDHPVDQYQRVFRVQCISHTP